MAAKNTREIELALSITTANAEALTKLQEDVKELAGAGGKAAPEFKVLADELGKLSAQAKQLTALEGLTAELGRASTAQRTAADASGSLKQKLDEATAAAARNKEAEREKALEITAASRKIQELKDAQTRLTAETDKADRGTAAYKQGLRALNVELLDAKAKKRELQAQEEQLKTVTQQSTTAVAAQKAAYDAAADVTKKAASATRELQTQVDAATAKYRAAGGAVGTLAESQLSLVTALARAKKAISDTLAEQDRLIASERALAAETLRHSALIAETKRKQAAQAHAEAAGILADYAKMEAAQKAAAASAKAAGDALNNAFGTVGVRSAAAIRAEIEKVKAAMQTLRTSGDLTGSELATAMAKGKAGVKALERELREVSGTLNMADKAANLFKGSMGQITAGNMLANAIGFLVQKVKDMAVAFVRTTAETETLRRALMAIYKDTGLAAAQFEFLKATANASGVSIKGIQAAFVQFSAATKSANIPLQTSNELFAAVTRTAGSLGLSADAAGGALNALGQMASKGVVSLEELRQQLGDRMPGALGAAAKGLGLTEAELIKLVESGNLAARDFFPAFTKGLSEMQGSAEGLVPTYNRLANAVLLLGQNMGDAGFLTLFTRAMKALGAAVGVVGGILSGFVEVVGLTVESLKMLDYTNGTMAERYATYQKAVSAAAERQSKFSDAIDVTISSSNTAITAAANLATATQATTIAAAAAGDKWDSMSRSAQAAAIATQIATQRQGEASTIIAGTVATIEQLLDAQKKETDAREKSAKAVAQQGDTLVRLAKLHGDEVGVLDAVVTATEAHAISLDKAARSQTEEVRLLELQRETIVKNRAEMGLSTEAILKEVQALDKKILTAKAEAEQADASAAAARALAESSRIQRAAYDDNSKAIEQYLTAIKTLKDELSSLEVAHAAGVATEAQVLKAREALAEATFKLRDAYKDAAEAARSEAQVRGTALEISRMSLTAEVDLLNAKASLARASGDLTKATELERKAKEAKLKIDQLSIDIKRIELDLARQELEIALKKLEIEEPLNALKRKSLELQLELNAAQGKGLDAAKELLDLRGKEIKITEDAKTANKQLAGSHKDVADAVKGHVLQVNNLGKSYSDAGAAALAARGHFASAAMAQKNADTAASSITKKGPSASEGVWTQSAIVEYLKQSGLDEKLSVDLSKQFLQPDGSVDYKASAAQKKWGGNYSTLSEALGKMSEYYRFNDSGKNEADSRLKFLQGAQGGPTPPNQAPAAPQKSAVGGTPVTINLNGNTRTINTDAQGAAALQGLFQQLGAAAGRT